MNLFSLGKSYLGQDILCYHFPQTNGKRVLLMGGVHGDEIEGVAFCQNWIAHLIHKPIPNLDIYIIPMFNPDAVYLRQRANSRGVDLNRNLPTKDWQRDAFNPRYEPGPHALSEIENQILVEFLANTKLDFILSYHSFSKFLLNVNGNCEPIASLLKEKTGYPIEESMGYPSPGCLGTYTGLERGIPTLTYELERGKPLNELLQVHIPALDYALRTYSKEPS